MGCSTDSPKRNAKFKAKQGFEFPLICDEDRSVSTAYGVWGEKKFMGKLSLGVTRATFVIGGDGVVRHAFPKVKVKGHDQQVLDVL